jgi:hypothetical protein
MKKNLPNFVLYIAIITFLLGVIALTQAMITQTSASDNQTIQNIDLQK